MEISVPDSFLVCVAVGLEVAVQVNYTALNLLAVHGKGVDIEHMESSRLNSSNCLVNLLLSSFSAGLAESGDRNGIVGVTLCPIDVDVLTLEKLTESVSIISSPYVGSGSECGLRSNAEHTTLYDGVSNGSRHRKQPEPLPVRRWSLHADR